MKPTREKFERMALRVAYLLQLSEANEYEALPAGVRTLFERYTYYELIRPLVFHDRHKKQLTLKQIAIAYGISYDQVWRMLSKKGCCEEPPGLLEE